MNQEEIRQSFRQSKNKREQIRILADLTDSDVDTVIEVLKDDDMCVAVTKCKRCKRVFYRYLSPFCPSCVTAMGVKQSRDALTIRHRIMTDRLRQHEQAIESLRLCINEIEFDMEEWDGKHSKQYKDSEGEEEDVT